MTNKIAVIPSAGKIQFTEKAVPTPQAGQVLVKIKSSGICGSDLHLFHDKHPMVKLPVTPGHEFSGDVVALGEGVTAFSIGDRVAVEPVLICGTCEACHLGQYGYCENISFSYRKGHGAFADYFVAEAKFTYQLPESISYDAGAMLEPMAVAVHAVRRANIQIGESVLITGAGTIGILIAALCRYRGARDIIITDLSEGRLTLAKKMGATHTINTGEADLGEALSALGYAKGLHQAFECVGHPVPLNQCIEALKANGQLTIIGLSNLPAMECPVTRIVTKELRVQGSQGYTHDFKSALGLMERAIDVTPLITHTFPLDELQKAFEVAESKATGALKVIVNP